VSRRIWVLAHAAVVIGFLAAVASYYRPGAGFTAFLTLPAASHEYELPAVRAVPHDHDPTGGYDGQFYAQLAVDPLLTNPAIDVALDNAPFRARRILFSWTAYLVGLGRPAWVLEAFALQNVACWLLLAWLLLRWFPIGSLRSFVLWSGCLLSHGMLGSVRYALLDGPSLVLVAAAAAAVESARPWVASAVLGLAGLARETNLLAAVAVIARFAGRSARAWFRVAGCLGVVVLPLLLWIDYLRSIYVTQTFVGAEGLVVPLTGFLWKLSATARSLQHGDWSIPILASAAAIVSIVTQSGWAAWLAFSRDRSPWLPLALSFAVLALCSHAVIWSGSPGAVTRVALPLLVGFNVLARTSPWPVLILGNLTVIPGVIWFVLSA
jgi:hypothetical protein